MSGSSGRSLGRIGLTVIGSIVGGAFGMPGVGAAIGGMLGGLLFPEKIPGVSGPRLGDQQLTTSTEGTAIPLLYGRHVVSGNIIWAAPLEEVNNTEKQGGKGGPTQKVTTFTYFLSHAVALCEGVITGVQRIWENGKLIYDRRAQQDGESATAYAARLAASDELDEQMTIYLGGETQLPDSLIESHEGVGEVSAHRGLAYVVFERRDVTDSGGRPKQYQFEVTRAELIYTPTTELAADALYDWNDSGADPRNPGNEHGYPTSATTLSAAIADAEALAGYSLNSGIIGWNDSSGSYAQRGEEPLTDDRETLYLTYNHVTPSLYFYEMVNTGFGINGIIFRDAGIDNDGTLFYWTGRYPSGPSGASHGVWFVLPSSEPNPYPGIATAMGTDGGAYPVVSTIYLINDAQVAVRRIPSAPDLPGSEFPDWPVDPDDYWQDPDSGTIYSKQPYAQVADNYRWLAKYETGGAPLVVTQRPLGPVLLQGDANDTEAYWTAAYDAAVDSGDIPSGKTYNAAGTGGINTYPRNASYAWTRAYVAITYAESNGVTVGFIVRDQCERSGMTNDEHFDVSTLDQIIAGYKVERLLNGRDIIAPLRQFALFDGVETDKLRFPLRGGAVVATLTEDDLGAHEFGTTPPPLVEAQHIEDVELPYAVRVRYADVDSEYQPSAQPATRKVTAGRDSVDIETTIAMDATEAAQMADVLLQEPWMRRQSYDLNIGPQWLALTAADPILIPLRGEAQRCVISEDTRAMPGIIEAKAFRDDASIYASNATGTPGGAGEQTLTPIGDTDLVIIDSAAYLSSHNDAGVFLAACGASDRWDGYGLFESTDGGSNFSRIAAYETASTMGTLIDAIPEGPFELWDYENEIVVAMDNGTLESRTQDELTLSGANAMFVGADGRWEIIQFASAVAEGMDSSGRVIYRLSTLLRGRQGTEWAIGSSQAGDRMAMCSTTQRLAIEVSRVGIPRLLKAISFGRTTESGPEQTFTPQGVALKPYAPTLPEGQRDGSGNLDIYAVRRTRISAEWNDSDYVPLNEEIEAYEIDILRDVDVVRTLSGSSFPIEYSATDQVADLGFGSAVDTLLIEVRNVIEMAGYVYGIYHRDTISVRSYSYVGDTYTYIGGQAVGAPAGDTMTGFDNDGTALFVSVANGGGTVDGIYRFEPASGVVGAETHSITYGTAYCVRGLVRLGASVWFTKVTVADKFLVEVSTADLSAISSINVASLGSPSGIATDGTDLYVLCAGTPSKLARYTTAGSLVWSVDVDSTANNIQVVGGVAWALSTTYLRAYSVVDGTELARHAVGPGTGGTGIIEAAGRNDVRLLTYDGHLYARSQLSGTVGFTVFDSAIPDEAIGSTHDGQYFSGNTDIHVVLTTGSSATRQDGTGFVSTVHRRMPVDGVDIAIYQISTSVGRGYHCEATI